jgi:hypothetical protein
MKRLIVTFPVMFLIVEVATSWWVWSGQPSHGLVDVYDFSFIRYETERLLPWALIALVVLGLSWLTPNLLYRSKVKE